MKSIQTAYCKQFVSDIPSAITSRLSKHETNVLYITDAVLDPRFKRYWKEQAEVEEINNTVITEMQNYYSGESSHVSFPDVSHLQLLHSMKFKLIFIDCNN